MWSMKDNFKSNITPKSIIPEHIMYVTILLKFYNSPIRYKNSSFTPVWVAERIRRKFTQRVQQILNCHLICRHTFGKNLWINITKTSNFEHLRDTSSLKCNTQRFLYIWNILDRQTGTMWWFCFFCNNFFSEEKRRRPYWKIAKWLFMIFSYCKLNMKESATVFEIRY